MAFDFTVAESRETASRITRKVNDVAIWQMVIDDPSQNSNDAAYRRRKAESMRDAADLALEYAQTLAAEARRLENEAS